MQTPKKSNARIWLIVLFLTLGFVWVLINLFQIQVLERRALVEKIAEDFPRVKFENMPFYRGAILDRNDKYIAISVPTVSVYAFPRFMKNKDEFVRRISAILDIPEESIRQRLDTNRKFVWIALRVDKEKRNLIERVIRETGNTSAVGIQEDFKRFYPHGSMASNLTGFVGFDGKGLEGLEYLFNDLIGGKSMKVMFFAGGSMILDSHKEEPLKLQDIKTTIDIGVQIITEDITEKISKQWRPRRVAILVMDVKNGDILALSTYPNYDPNFYWKYKPGQRRNYAVTDIFEPGSTIKPFFIGKALDKGYVDVNFGTTIGDKIEVYGRYVKDVKPSKYLSIDKILAESSNIGTIKIARYLSKKDIEELINDVHLDKTFGVLPGETKPKLPNLSYPANQLYISIGQGLAVNLLNLCVAFGGLATNKIVKPKILVNEETVVLNNGIFSDKTYMWLRKNMIKVVEEGTAQLAKSNYFYIAGKTGTSQKFDFSTGRYSRENLVAYFVGYFPATDPKIVAGIMVDEPQGQNVYGGTVAAPYFKELAERVASYYRLKPDKLTNPAN